MSARPVCPTRRGALRQLAQCATAAGLGLGLAACAVEPAAPEAGAAPGEPLRWRVLSGGFLTPALGALGLPAAGQSGLFVRFTAPLAIALRGHDLLVADGGPQRLWRAELGTQLMSGIADAPVSPQVALALGPDLSAWVLDPLARRVLRFARDGRLLQSQRIELATPTPAALLLVDGGATLLLGDGLGARWSEQRGAGAPLRSVAPEDAAGRRIGGVDALAPSPRGLFVLDRLAGVVHEVDRDGRVLATLGRGELMQPVALASDRRGRAYVLEGRDGSLLRLRADAPPRRWSAAALGALRPVALAADGDLVALADLGAAQVIVLSFAHDDTP